MLPLAPALLSKLASDGEPLKQGTPACLDDGIPLRAFCSFGSKSSWLRGALQAPGLPKLCPCGWF